jgi:FKBP-type peptidyl-prolyl cis-trans isomerase
MTMRIARYAFALLMVLFLAETAVAADGTSSNRAFLAANATRQGVVTRPSGLQYRILRKGFGKRPGPHDLVQVYYTGTLADGRVFDGTSPGLPASLSVNNVIPGLAEALSLMHEGDRWQITVPPNLAFGNRGTPGGTVPPDQIVVFDLTLVSVSGAPAAQSQATASPLSVWTSGREQGAMLTIHP